MNLPPFKAYSYARRHGCLALLLLCAALFLCACDKAETPQDLALIALLENEVLRKAPGLPLPPLSQEARADLGDRARAYDTLLRFRASLQDLLLRNLRPLQAAVTLETLAETLEGRLIIAEAARSAAELRRALSDELERARGERRVLALSPQAGEAYDAAFEHSLGRPATAAIEMIDACAEYFSALLDLAQELARNEDGYIVEGDTLHLTLADQEARMEHLVAAIQEKRERIFASSWAYTTIVHPEREASQ